MWDIWLSAYITNSSLNETFQPWYLVTQQKQNTPLTGIQMQKM